MTNAERIARWRNVMPTTWHARLHVGQANTIYH